MDGVMVRTGSQAGETGEPRELATPATPMDEAAFERFNARTSQALWAYLLSSGAARPRSS